MCGKLNTLHATTFHRTHTRTADAEPRSIQLNCVQFNRTDFVNGVCSRWRSRRSRIAHRVRYRSAPNPPPPPPSARTPGWGLGWTYTPACAVPYAPSRPSRTRQKRKRTAQHCCDWMLSCIDRAMHALLMRNFAVGSSDSNPRDPTPTPRGTNSGSGTRGTREGGEETRGR